MSTTVNCTHCGLPFKDDHSDAEHHFCCSGCELVYQITGDSGQQTKSSTSFLPESLVIRFVLAFILTMPLMLIAVTDYIEPSIPYWMHLLSFGGATAVLLLLGKEHILQLKSDIGHRKFGLSSLILIGVISSYTISVFHFLTELGPTFFETTAMLMVFYTGSILIDIYLKNKIKAETNIDKSSTSLVEKRVDNSWSYVPVTDISPGDIIRTAPYQPVPCDGKLHSEAVLLSQVHLTGESDLITATPGQEISSGSFSTDHYAEIEVSRPYTSSRLYQYLLEADQSLANRSHLEDLSDRLSIWLLIAISSIAVVTFIYSYLQIDLYEALFRSLAVLLIGCPCTFSIATPAAFWITHRQLFNKGIVLKKGNQLLELLSQTRSILFDKTGTLTDELTVDYVQFHERNFSKSEITSFILSLESGSEHPVARAIKNWARDRTYTAIPLDRVEILPGKGLKGVHTATDDIVILQTSSGEQFYIECLINGVSEAEFTLKNPWRSEALDLFDHLKKQDISSYIVTGDPRSVDELEKHPSLSGYYKGCSPEEKNQILKSIRNNTQGKLAFVGDGINDVGAMASADISVALSSGSLEAASKADILIHNDALSALRYLLEISKKALRTVKLNIGWSVIYNIFGITLAVMGLLHPVFSVSIMMISSIFVTFQSLRLSNV